MTDPRNAENAYILEEGQSTYFVNGRLVDRHGTPIARTADGQEPVAWLDMRSEPATDWTKRVVATNPEYVTNNGPENFVPLYTSPQPAPPTVEWRPVVGFEDSYEVSSDGDIRNKNTGLILAKNTVGKGYIKADLWAGNIRKQTSMHRVVAEAFVPRRDGANEVNHIDGDKANNKASNLEWTDRRGNMHHSRYVLGNDVKPVLATDPVTGEVEYFPSIEEAGRRGYNASAIFDVLSGRNRTHSGKTWTLTEWRDPATHPVPDGPAPAVSEAEVLREAIRDAIDLLAERTYGNPARSPGHNARVILEAAQRARK